MRRFACLLLLAFLLASCDTSDGVFENGPRLISEVTIPPVTTAPTRAFSPTPSRATMRPTDPPPEVTETAADFEVITPTLPPSKTPTITPSVTNTPQFTATEPPTREPQPTEEPILVPTYLIVTAGPQIVAQAPDVSQPVTSSDVSANVPGVPDEPAAPCSVPWFFNNPRLPDCPPNAPLVTEAAFQSFQFGFMVWVGAQDAIYVLYDSADMPRWEVYQDMFEAGMPETDPSLDSQAPPYAEWQPKRGFGLLWREVPGMRDRLGWAESAYEAAYTINIQTRTDGTIYFSEPFGRVFGLLPNGDWELYN